MLPQFIIASVLLAIYILCKIFKTKTEEESKEGNPRRRKFTFLASLISTILGACLAILYHYYQGCHVAIYIPAFAVLTGVVPVVAMETGHAVGIGVLLLILACAKYLESKSYCRL